MFSPLPSTKGAHAELTARGNTLQAEQEQEEMWVRWIQQRNHGELGALQLGLDLPDDLDTCCSIQSGEQQPYSADVEREAQRLKAAVEGDTGMEPAAERMPVGMQMPCKTRTASARRAKTMATTSGVQANG